MLKIFKGIAFYSIVLFIMVGLTAIESFTGLGLTLYLVLSILGIIGLYLMFGLDEESKQDFEDITFARFFK